ncbi:hypothetical protein AKO1_006186, partial [Acrasis kona]
MGSMLQFGNDLVDELHGDVLSCFRAVLNIEVGMRAVLSQPDVIRVIVLSLEKCTNANRSSILLLLALLCRYSEEALSLALDGLSHYKLVKREPRRFSSICDWIIKSSDIKLRIHALMFFNALLNTPSDPRLRSDLQQEFINLDILKRIKELDIKSEDVLTQVEVFEEELQYEFNSHFAIGTDPQQIANVLNNQLNQDNRTRLVKILSDLVSISTAHSTDNSLVDHNWIIVEKVIKTLVNEMDDKGNMKDISQVTDKLKDNLKSQQATLSDLEEKIKTESKKIVTFM